MRYKHYRVEVLYGALDGAACGKSCGALTDDHTKVTCPKCKEAVGL